MKITNLQNCNTAAECVFLLSRQYSSMQTVPDSADKIVEGLQENYGIPTQALSECIEPVRKVETHILENLNASQEDLDFLFGDCTPYVGGIGWALYFLELEDIDLAGLSEEALTRELRHLMRITLDTEMEHMSTVKTLGELMGFLDTTSCSTHLKWCCMKIWDNPVHYQKIFREILERAETLFREAMEEVQEEVDLQIREALQAHPEALLEKLGIQEERANIILSPSLLAFNDAGLNWDPARPEDPAYMFVGILYQRIADLVNRYNNNSEYLSSTLKTIADKRRLEILMALKEHPYYGHELADMLSISACTVSHHMNYLLTDGFVKVKKQGTRISYSLEEEALRTFLQSLNNALLK